MSSKGSFKSLFNESRDSAWPPQYGNIGGKKEVKNGSGIKRFDIKTAPNFQLTDINEKDDPRKDSKRQ